MDSFEFVILESFAWGDFWLKLISFGPLPIFVLSQPRGFDNNVVKPSFCIHNIEKIFDSKNETLFFRPRCSRLDSGMTAEAIMAPATGVIEPLVTV